MFIIMQGHTLGYRLPLFYFNPYAHMTVFAFTAGSLGDIFSTIGLTAHVVHVFYDYRNKKHMRDAGNGGPILATRAHFDQCCAAEIRINPSG